MAISPLVARHTPIQVRKPPQTPLATAVVVANTGEENIGSDVSLPAAAAKARTTMVNSSFVANIKTPVSLFQKTPHIPLQKAVLLSAARKTGKIVLDTPSEARRRMNNDETVLAASTPQGLAESISFNVSSAIPPYPIPPTASVNSYTTRPTRKSTRRSTRKSASVQNVKVASSTLATGGVSQAAGRGSVRPGRKRAKTRVTVTVSGSVKQLGQARADISMLPPSSDPQKLDKWKIDVQRNS